MSEVLEVDIEDIGQMALNVEKEVNISNMCTIFVESEVISKLAENITKDSILKGIYSSIFFRILALGKKVGITPPLKFTGRVARNIGIVKMLSSKSGIDESEILIAPYPQIIGSLGASIFGIEI